MIRSPLDKAVEFWRPALDPSELGVLGRYVGWGDTRTRGVQVLRTDAEAQCYRVDDGEARYLLFASVYPIAAPPDSAEVLAEIKCPDGSPHSFILWYPAEQCALIPFDPNEAIEALQFERYMQVGRKTVLPPPVLAGYYTLRPLVPRSVRMALRRSLARSTSHSEHLLAWPSDVSLDHLLRLLLRVVVMVSGRESLMFLWFWPAGRPWAAVLTHDVETADGLARVRHVMELEKARGLRSSFNLVPRDYEVPESLLVCLRKAGFEIGVHGYTHDGLMFTNRSAFLKRVDKVNEFGRAWGAVGFRSPATYRNPDWFDRLDFEYDSSFTDTAPYEPQPGGCASLFPFMIGDVVEAQMTLPQDHTLFGLLGQTDADVWLRKLDLIKDAHGMACVLTHPDSGDGYIGREANEAHYLEVLDYIACSEAWTPVPRDLARWWRARLATDPLRTNALTGACMARASLDTAGRLRVEVPT